MLHLRDYADYSHRILRPAGASGLSAKWAWCLLAHSHLIDCDAVGAYEDAWIHHLSPAIYFGLHHPPVADVEFRLFGPGPGPCSHNNDECGCDRRPDQWGRRRNADTDAPDLEHAYPAVREARDGNRDVDCQFLPGSVRQPDSRALACRDRRRTRASHPSYRPGTPGVHRNYACRKHEVGEEAGAFRGGRTRMKDRKSTRLNSSHLGS